MCEGRRDGRCSFCKRGVLGREGLSCHQSIMLGGGDGPGGLQVGGMALA